MAEMDDAPVHPIIVEDCDIIYPRAMSPTANGGKVFAKRSDQPTDGSRVDVIFRDIRITDPYQTLSTFEILSTGIGTGGNFKTSSGNSGITFKNISSVRVPKADHNKIIGHSGGIWNDITFDNVVLGGRRITKTSDFSDMGPYVTNIKFINSQTSVNETKALDGEFNIIANGATQKLNVSAASKIIDKIQLIDMTGKLVYSSKSNKHDSEIDLSGIANGIYIVKINTKDRNYSYKFIKK
jgi:hypothetical protein